MDGLFFTDDHEYVEVKGEEGVVGITDYAQDALGDIVYVEVPEVGKKLEKGDEVGVVESVKSASEMYSPVSGEVIEVNENLADAPALLNEDAEGEGWIFKIKLNDPEEVKNLKTEADYQTYLESV